MIVIAADAPFDTDAVQGLTGFHSTRCGGVLRRQGNGNEQNDKGSGFYPYLVDHHIDHPFQKNLQQLDKFIRPGFIRPYSVWQFYGQKSRKSENKRTRLNLGATFGRQG